MGLNPITITCINVGCYPNALTFGKTYTLLRHDQEKQQVKICGDNGRARWFKDLYFNMNGDPALTIQSISIDDPIEDPACDCVEVTIRLSSGGARWCYIATPRWLLATLDQGSQSKEVEKGGLRMGQITMIDRPIADAGGAAGRFIAVPFLIIISMLTEPMITAALHDLEIHNRLIESTTELR